MKTENVALLIRDGPADIVQPKADLRLSHLGILGITRKLYILNMGGGVESCAIWAEWYHNPESRPFESWDQLIVIMSQTGDEHVSTKRLMERYILPQMAEVGVRFIQVAKPKKGCSSRGYVVLEDTREPRTLHIRDERIHSLSSDLENAGTIVARSAVHHCAQKHKGLVIDRLVVDLIYYEMVCPPSSEDLGYVILDDTRMPTTLHIRDGRIRGLAEDLGAAGATVSRAATHFCAIERKGNVIGRVLTDLIYHEIIAPPASSLAADLERLRDLGLTHGKDGIPLDDIQAVYKALCDGRGRFPEPGTQKYRTALVSLIDAQLSIGPIIGYNAEETKRIEKSKEYTFRGVQYVYPLPKWGWTRAWCLYTLWYHYGVLWEKSACYHCPYCEGNEAAQRWIREPEAGAQTLWLEYKTGRLNERMEALYNGGTAMSFAIKHGAFEAIARFEAKKAAAQWQLWWVRRTVVTRWDAKEKKFKKSIKRCTQAVGLWESYDEAAEYLQALAAAHDWTVADAAVDVVNRGALSGGDGKGTAVDLEARLVVAPDDMADKVQYEKSFEANWALGGGPMLDELLNVVA